MNRKKAYIIGVSLLFVAVIVIEIFGPREPDWSMSFSRYSKEPYGNYLLYDFMKTLFPDKKISTVHDPAYGMLKERKYRHYNYFLLNDRCVFDEPDSRELLQFVSEGNNAFIAAHFFSETGNSMLTDELGFKSARYPEIYTGMGIRFVNSRISRRVYVIKTEGGAYYFSKINSNKTAILSVNEKKDPVYIRIKYGKGYFYISSLPLAFTNYCIVSSESDYPFMALSYLPVYNILWDEFYKIGRLEARTPLRFILSREPLRWAYAIGMTVIGLVIISGAKRKQRIIPELPPVVNTSLEFVLTVGSLYYQNKDHKDLAHKKIAYFFEYIRFRLYLDTRELNDAFFERLASKTGLSFSEIQKLFSFIESIQEKKRVTERDLLALNAGIDEVYRRGRGLTK